MTTNTFTIICLISALGCTASEYEDEQEDGKADGTRSLYHRYGLLKPSPSVTTVTFTRLLLQKDSELTYGYFFASVGDRSGDHDALEGEYRLRQKDGKRLITFENDANETVGGTFYYRVDGADLVLDAVDDDNALGVNKSVRLRFQSAAEIMQAIIDGFVADYARTDRSAIPEDSLSPEVSAALATVRARFDADAPIKVYSFTVDFEDYYSIEVASGIRVFICDAVGTMIANGTSGGGDYVWE